MGFTTTYANTILSNLVNGAYIALTTAAPTASSTGGTLSEPSVGAGYACVQINTNNGNFKTDKRNITNQAYIYFPEAISSWGTITHMCFVSAAQNGDLRYFGALNSPVAVTVTNGQGVVPLFKPNTINISLDAD